MIQILEKYFEKNFELRCLLNNKEAQIIEIVGEEDVGKSSLAIWISKQLKKDSIVFYQSFDRKITSSYLTDKSFTHILSLEAGVSRLSTCLFSIYKEIDIIIIDGFPFCDEPKKLLDILQVIKERRSDIKILLVNQLRYSIQKKKDVSFYEKYVNRITDYRIFLSKKNDYVSITRTKKVSDEKLKERYQQLLDAL